MKILEIFKSFAALALLAVTMVCAAAATLLPPAWGQVLYATWAFRGLLGLVGQEDRADVGVRGVLDLDVGLGHAVLLERPGEQVVGHR